MATFMDYTISPLPLRIVDSLADDALLRVRGMRLGQIGHLPGRTLRRKSVAFDHWAVLYIVGGEGFYQVDDGDVQPVGPGDLFPVRPGASFSFGPSPGRHWDEYYVRFEGSRTDEWLASGLLVPDRVRHVGVNDVWKQKLESLFALLETGIPADADRAALSFESLVFEFAQADEQPQSSGKAGLPHRLYDYLASGLYRQLEANDIASHHHISVSTLRRFVKKTTGCSLGEYIHRLKVAEAKKLLLNTDRKVKEIAGLLGYEDVYYFSRTFKRISGVSADRFRREHGE